MPRKKHSIYRARFCLWFQESTGSLGMYPLWIRETIYSIASYYGYISIHWDFLCTVFLESSVVLIDRKAEGMACGFKQNNKKKHPN